MLALAHVHGHLEQPQLRVRDAHQRLDLGGFADIGVGEQLERAVVDGVEAAGAVGDRLPEPQSHQQAQQRGAHDALGRRPVALAVAAGLRQEAGAHGDVAGVGAHQREHAGELGRRVLAVGVEAAAVVVAVVGRMPVALGDAVAQPAVRGKVTTRAPPARATSAVPSVDPSSITSRSASGRSWLASASTSGKDASSFHAGMNTSVRATGEL